MAKNNGKGGPLTNENKAHIIKELKTLVMNRNINHTNYEKLAETFNTTRQTISKYVDEIYASVPPEDIEKTFIDFRFIFERLEKEVDKALKEARTIKERMEVVNTYFRLMKEKTDILERFFKKAREISASEEKLINDKKIEVQVIYGGKVDNETTN